MKIQTNNEEKISLSLLLASVSLSFGAAIALGLARFSYALLLPLMKADLGWNFAQAGALNTSNATGYLIGALIFPFLARRISVSNLFIGSCVLTALLMATAGYTFDFDVLLAQRLACGIFSAIIFVSGGVLATRLATTHPQHSGLVLGVYYGGVGWGIAISALVVPWTSGSAATAHGWQAPWIALAGVCALCALLAWPTAQRMTAGAAVTGSADNGTCAGASGAATQDSLPHVGLSRYTLLLTGYGLFGIGYIGYMTFIIALLRTAAMSSTVITAFYVALGLAVVISGRLWSRVLQRARAGGAFALFCCLLGIATLIPALTLAPVAVFLSGIVFGATFLAVVTSTTAFVRHNLPSAHWSAGISTFTSVFAIGQIVGPVVMGKISDGSGLSQGFIYSALTLFVGAIIAFGQKPLS